MNQILICPNAFKGSLEAEEVAASIKAGLERSNLVCECTTLPIADGGDGSLRVIAEYVGADILSENVSGPLGWSTMASYGWNLKTRTAFIELAEASGIHLLNQDQMNPWEATSYGTGQLINTALGLGAKKVYLMLGGSATVDGALGMLNALGVVFFHETGLISRPLPTDLIKIADISVEKINPELNDVEFIILCDVDNPLLGTEGAAAVFAPQKGASNPDIKEFERGFENLSEVIQKKFGKDIRQLTHGGAAGGVAAVLHGILGAKLANGGEEILKWAGFDEKLAQADIVITGEGRIDPQTKYGKGPGLIARKADEAGKYVIGLCGSVDAGSHTFDHFDAVLPVTHGPDLLSRVMANTSTNLERTALQIGNLLALQVSH